MASREPASLTNKKKLKVLELYFNFEIFEVFSFSRADKAFEIFEVFEVFSLLCNLQDEPRF